MKPPTRRGGVLAHAARALVIALCPLLVVGCGAATMPIHRTPTPTPTPAATYAPPAVVGSVTSVQMVDAMTGWATAPTRLLRTTDGGLHWRDVTPPASPGSSPQDVAAFSLSGAEAWVWDCCGDVRHTTDGGQTWRAITAPVYEVIEITFADPRHGWMLANPNTADGEQEVDIFRTTDGGQTWALVPTAYDRPGGLPLKGFKSGLTFRDATTGWIPTSAGLFQTHDGGATWQPAAPLTLPAPLARGYSAEARSPIFFSPLVGVLPVELVSQATGVVAFTLGYVTFDGGATWRPTTPVQAPVQERGSVMDVLNPLHWWIAPIVGGDIPLFETNDGGQHWASWTPGAPFAGLSARSFGSDALGLAIGSAGLLRTTDGGHTWTILAAAPPAATPAATLMSHLVVYVRPDPSRCFPASRR